MSSSYPASGGGGGGGSGITALTGDVTAGPGSGSQAATVVAGHFGGTDGQFYKRVSGVWAPASLALTDLPAGGASSGQHLVWNGSAWAPATLAVALAAIAQGGATTGQVLEWNGSAWAPFTIPTATAAALGLAQADGTSIGVAAGVFSTLGAPPTGGASGDLSGSYPGPTVSKIRGKAVSAAPSVADQVLQYDGTNLVPVLLAKLEQSDGYLEWAAGAHLRLHSTATVPTVTTNLAAASVALAAGSSDMVGAVIWTVGANAPIGGTSTVTVTFGTAYTNIPFAFTTEGGFIYGAATASGRLRVNTISTTACVLSPVSALSANTTYALPYLVIGYV